MKYRSSPWISTLALLCVAGCSHHDATESTSTSLAVTAVSPAAGSHGGGVTLTVSGRGFASDANLRLGDVDATSVVVVNDTTLTAVSPPLPQAGAVDVSVVSGSHGTATLAAGFTATNTPPVITVSPFAGVQSGIIALSFVAADADGDSCRIALELDSGSGFAQLPASDIVGGVLDHFSAPLAGAVHVLAFDSRAMLFDQNVNTATLRVSAFDDSDNAAGSVAITAPFAIRNHSDPTLTLLDWPALASHTATLDYRVAQPNPADPLIVSALTFNEPATSKSGTMTVTSGQALGAVAFSSSGSTSSTTWAAQSDLGYGNHHRVTLSVGVSDGQSTASATTPTLEIDNGPFFDAVPLAPALGVAAPGDAGGDGGDGGATPDAPPPSVPSPVDLALGDVDGDGFADLVFSLSGHFSSTVAVAANTAGGVAAFDAPRYFASPLLPGAFSASPMDPSNYFLLPSSALGSIADIDVNGDGYLDLLAADAFYGPPLTANPLVADASAALTAMAQDAANGFAHVIAHQATLRTVQSGGGLDFAGSTWESAQATIANLAPLSSAHVGGSVSSAATGDPGQDNVGWLTQKLLTIDLDGPTAPGHGSGDLVMLSGIYQLRRALSGDLTGVVLFRQPAPSTKQLGPAYYLDPTDLGPTPTDMAAGDLLGRGRATLGFSAPQGSADIVVVNGDAALTFYLQATAARWSPGYTPPQFDSFHLPLDFVTPAVAFGDAVFITLGDLNGDGHTDLIVVCQQTQRLLVFLYDPASALATRSGGLVPFRLAPTQIALEPHGVGRASVADVTGDGRADILLSSPTDNRLLLFANTGNDASGNATFAPPATFATGAMPVGLGVVDVNGDDKLDAITGNAGADGGLSLFLNGQ